jgi:hypothetical protein
MRFKHLVAVIAVSVAAGGAFAEPIDLDPYIPPSVRTDLVRSQVEQQQAQDLRNTAQPKVRGGPACAAKKHGEACSDSSLTAKSHPLK